MLKSTLTEKMTFDQIRYSMVWEDPASLAAGLEIRQSDVVLCIGSAGCNALALALTGPRAVVALDLSPAQIALIERKVEAIRHLPREELLALLGVGEGNPVAIYERIRARLSTGARAFWDASFDVLRAGIMGAGRLESYLRLFKKQELDSIWPPETIARFLASKTTEEQMEVFRSTDLARLKTVMAKYFSPENFGRGGRDPAQFAYMTENDLPAVLLQRFERLFSRQLLRENFFLRYFLTGRYPVSEGLGSPYLVETDLAKLRAATDRLELVQGDLEGFLSRCPEGAFDKLALSDVFEYVSEEHTNKLFSLIESRMSPGGRLAYWNCFVERKPDLSQVRRLKRLEELSSRISASDRLWFYGGFNVYQRTS
jgi:S-adenosylmethionine-diacylglycerol 3-amino-3-carboxypropyl transferase